MANPREPIATTANKIARNMARLAYARSMPSCSKYLVRAAISGLLEIEFIGICVYSISSADWFDIQALQTATTTPPAPISPPDVAALAPDNEFIGQGGFAPT